MGTSNRTNSLGVKVNTTLLVKNGENVRVAVSVVVKGLPLNDRMELEVSVPPNRMLELASKVTAPLLNGIPLESVKEIPAGREV